MPATSQITFINECRSFGSEQYTQKHDAPKRIPRSPNAFMLYRSDFLKRRAVPPEVEKRQQNLSRIAGRCWNMLPNTEKAIWYSIAAVVRAEHRARYPSHTIGPLHKDTNRQPARDKRKESAANSERSFSRSRARQKQSPYYEGMFAALHDSKISSPASQASLLSPPPTSVSSTASLSLLPLPHSLPPFTSHTQPSWQDSPPATSENSMIWREKVGYLLGSSGPKTPQWGPSRIIRDCEIVGILFSKATD
ncbi:hypothetical protein J3R83DRAFT_959 [Lanmaoa asiatica]|nr:hypothetical protein J3R83DRAFT_959 [Lanmaoa asiatica]